MVLKGIAILAIVLHNYFHMLWGAVGENEFDFEPGRLRSFISAVGEPDRLIQAFFSYFGHYGVLLFIFLSAYGLAIAHWQPPNYELGAAVCFTAFSLAVAWLVAWLARRIARPAAGVPPAVPIGEAGPSTACGARDG
jgi:hypothetical protein